LQIFEIEAWSSADLFAPMRARFLVASIVVCRAHASRGVNTSLSGKLFFSLCWCIRDAVHFDSRVHAAIKPSHIGGQHGEESEEGEEGEERSEEDCEEDQEGLEEEVTRLEEDAGGLMPARHTSLPTVAFSGKRI
jgi:hypothetical protein